MFSDSVAQIDKLPEGGIDDDRLGQLVTEELAGELAECLGTSPGWEAGKAFEELLGLPVVNELKGHQFVLRCAGSRHGGLLGLGPAP